MAHNVVTPIVFCEYLNGLSIFRFKCSECEKPIHATDINCKHCGRPINWRKIDGQKFDEILKNFGG